MIDAFIHINVFLCVHFYSGVANKKNEFRFKREKKNYQKSNFIFIFRTLALVSSSNTQTSIYCLIFQINFILAKRNNFKLSIQCFWINNYGCLSYIGILIDIENIDMRLFLPVFSMVNSLVWNRNILFILNEVPEITQIDRIDLIKNSTEFNNFDFYRIEDCIDDRWNSINEQKTVEKWSEIQLET